MDTSFYPDQNQYRSFNAAAALTAGLIVKQTADDTVNKATASTDAVIGVTVDAQTTADRPITVAQGGEARVRAGAAITRGQYLAADGSGRAVPITPAAGGGTLARCIGIAKETVSNADEFGVVQIAPCIVEHA